MKRLVHRWTICLAVGLTFVATGCKKEDPEHLSAVGRRIGCKVDGVLNKTNDRLTLQWREGSDAPVVPLDVRVRERLQWDRNLDGTAIQVSAQDAVIELHGNVFSIDQKQHAVELARTTVGVEQVVDHLVAGAGDSH
jgi:hypothetical protein